MEVAGPLGTPLGLAQRLSAEQMWTVDLWMRWARKPERYVGFILDEEMLWRPRGLSS